MPGTKNHPIEYSAKAKNVSPLDWNSAWTWVTTIAGINITLAGFMIWLNDKKAFFGTNSNSSISNDGSNMNIKTDEVAPSDLKIICGAEKTLELQTVIWDDMRVPSSSIRLGGAQPPTATAYKSGMVLAFPSNLNKTIFFNAQLPHSYKEGENIAFHIHFILATSGAGVGTENVKWDFTYSWANMGEAHPNATTVNTTIDIQNDVADIHIYAVIAYPIVGTGKKISSMLICSLTRDVAVADDYADNIYLSEVDFHFPKNTLGSRTLEVK